MVKMPKKASKTRMTRLVNELGRIEDEMRKLQARREEIKEQLVDAKVLGYTTNNYKVTISKYTSTRIDYARIVEYLKPSAKIIQRFTSLSNVTRMTVKSLGDSE